MHNNYGELYIYPISVTSTGSSLIDAHACRPYALTRDEHSQIYWNDAFAITAQRDGVNIKTRFTDYSSPLEWTAVGGDMLRQFLVRKKRKKKRKTDSISVLCWSHWNRRFIHICDCSCGTNSWLRWCFFSQPGWSKDRCHYLWAQRLRWDSQCGATGIFVYIHNIYYISIFHIYSLQTVVRTYRTCTCETR